MKDLGDPAMVGPQREKLDAWLDELFDANRPEALTGPETHE
jgi:hypothetical protein